LEHSDCCVLRRVQIFCTCLLTYLLNKVDHLHGGGTMDSPWNIRVSCLVIYSCIGFRDIVLKQKKAAKTLAPRLLSTWVSWSERWYLGFFRIVNLPPATPVCWTPMRAGVALSARSLASHRSDQGGKCCRVRPGRAEYTLTDPGIAALDSAADVGQNDAISALWPVTTVAVAPCITARLPIPSQAIFRWRLMRRRKLRPSTPSSALLAFFNSRT